MLLYYKFLLEKLFVLLQDSVKYMIVDDTQDQIVHKYLFIEPATGVIYLYKSLENTPVTEFRVSGICNYRQCIIRAAVLEKCIKCECCVEGFNMEEIAWRGLAR